MTKTYLLAAAAVTALVAAGSAQAGSLSARAGTAPVVVTPAAPYRLARELNFGAGVASTVGQFDTIFTFNNVLAAGSYTVTLAYTGATITTPLSTTPVNSPAGGAVGGVDTTNALGFEISNANGGNGPSSLTVVNQSTTQVTLALQIPAGSTVGAIYLSPALLVTGPVSVTAAVSNQISGQNIDPAVIQALITTGSQSIAVRTNRTITAADGNAFGDGAGLNTRIEEGVAPSFFDTLLGSTVVNGPYQLGQVDIAVAGTAAYDTILANGLVSTPVYRDLNGTAVALTDVTSATISVTGIFNGLTATANSTAGAITPANVVTTGTTTVVTAPGGPQISTTTFLVDETNPDNPNGSSPQLQPSDFDVSVQLALAAGFTSPAATNGSFETLQIDGFSYIIPWVASQTQSGVSGNQSVIRVSNIRSDASSLGGRVYVQVYNPTVNPQIVTAGQAGSSGTAVPNATLAAGRSVFIGTLGTTGELVISSASLQQALGDFGRADLRLTVATRDSATNGANNLPGGLVGQSTIVVKRLIATSNGGLTEVEILAGSNANAQGNLPVAQGVGY